MDGPAAAGMKLVCNEDGNNISPPCSFTCGIDQAQEPSEQGCQLWEPCTICGIDLPQQKCQRCAQVVYGEIFSEK